MKTTIELSDALFQRAKRVALERGTTLRALIEEALERVVGGTLDRATPLETITFGDTLERLPDIHFGHYANPDTDDPAYVAKRLGLDSSPSTPSTPSTTRGDRGGRR
jgi:Bacterial antitoxin of type II TA system, VapB